MNHNFRGEFGRVIMKPLTREYIEELRLLRNRDDIRQWFINSNVVTKEEQEEWFEKYLIKPNDYMFVVFEKKNPNVFIGSWAAYNFSDDGKCFEVGRRMIHYDKVSERGLGYDIHCCGIKTIFDHTNAEKAMSEVLSINERSIQSNLKVGFTIGERITKDNVELVHMYITRDEFNKRYG